MILMMKTKEIVKGKRFGSTAGKAKLAFLREKYLINFPQCRQYHHPRQTHTAANGDYWRECGKVIISQSYFVGPNEEK